MNIILSFISSSNIISFTNKYLKFLIAIMLLFFFVGIYYSFYASPADYQQNDYVRIMYTHVPSAWLSLGIYSFMAVTSFIYLVWHNPIFDLMAKSASPIGAIFCFITLYTGSLWGKPIWGTWWAWDARLTSMLILLFFYIGYLSLVSATSHQYNSKAPAALAIVGFVNIPIVKFSVNLWNSLHQPASIIRLAGPSIHKSMLVPLMLMFICFSLYFIINFLILLNIRLLQAKKRYKIKYF
jgi:heme exporter protein C